jgi:hypothetical protein
MAQQSDNLFFNSERLQSLAKKYAKEYQSAEPFSHCFIDNFLKDEDLAPVLSEFPDVDDKQLNLSQKQKMGSLLLPIMSIFHSMQDMFLISLIRHPFFSF